MKRLFNILLLTGLALTACKEKKADPKARLEELRKEAAELSQEIRKLEEEVAKQDPSLNDKEAKDVVVEKLTPSTFNSYIEVQGHVESRQTVDVSSKAPGMVTAILVREGDQVRKGQLLARLDDEIVRKGITELKNQLSFATQVFEKQKSLWEQKIGTEIQFLQAKTNKEALELKLASMKEQESMMSVTAPVDGTVDLISLKVGQMASPGYPGIRIVNGGDIRLVSELAETYFGKVKSSDKALVVFTGSTDEHTLPVHYVGNVIDPVNRTFRIECKIPAGKNILPNMTAAVKINDATIANALVVPANLVQNHGEGDFVFIVKEENGKRFCMKKNVTIGKSYGGKTVVLSGLQAGETIITRGYNELNDGQQIKF